MKRIGLFIVVLSIGLMRGAWHDQVEGGFFRLVAFFGIVVGVVVYLEGLKRDIIEALSAKLHGIASDVDGHADEIPLPTDSPGR